MDLIYCLLKWYLASLKFPKVHMYCLNCDMPMRKFWLIWIAFYKHLIASSNLSVELYKFPKLLCGSGIFLSNDIAFL